MECSRKQAQRCTESGSAILTSDLWKKDSDNHKPQHNSSERWAEFQGLLRTVQVRLNGKSPSTLEFVLQTKLCLSDHFLCINFTTSWKISLTMCIQLINSGNVLLSSCVTILMPDDFTTNWVYSPLLAVALLSRLSSGYKANQVFGEEHGQRDDVEKIVSANRLNSNVLDGDIWWKPKENSECEKIQCEDTKSQKKVKGILNSEMWQYL